MKLIIFDVDGVLEKEELLLQKRKEAQIKEIAKRHNVSIEEAREMIPKAKLRLPKEKSETSVYILQKLGFTRQEYFDIINSINPEGIIEPHDGIEILEELKGKFKLVAYSNTPLHALNRTLEIINVKDKFEKVYSVEYFNESKPSPKILKQIIKKEGFTPENSYYIGNSVPKDMAPAKEVGCVAIFFNPDNKEVDKTLFDIEIHNLMELKEIIK